MSEMPGQTPATEPAEPDLAAAVDHNAQSAGDESEPDEAPIADPSRDSPGTGS